MLRLTRSIEPLVDDAERYGFRRLVVGLFGFRRKQLLRGLRELTGWDAERVAPALAARRARPDGAAGNRGARRNSSGCCGALVDGGWAAR